MSYSMSLQLNTRQAQSLKQTQRLIMSPQMQQAIQMLQLSVMELEQVVDAELEQNPVLEYAQEVDQDDPDQMAVETAAEEMSLEGDGRAEEEFKVDDKDFEVMRHLDEEFVDHFAASGSAQSTRTKEQEELQSFLESSIQGTTTLGDKLLNQARETFECESELEMAQELIGHLNDQGFLDTALEEIALLNEYEQGALEEVLQELQEFDPPGVAARDLRESLMIQLRRRGRRRSLAFQIVEEHFDDLLHNRIPAIQKGLSASAEAIQISVEEDIKPLDLQPGGNYSSIPAQHVTADVKVIDTQGELQVEVNDDSLPPLRLNRRYMRMLDDESLTPDVKDYIVKKAMSGRWLLRNIHQRNETLYRITSALTRHQKEFFEEPNGELKPLTMKVVAEELEVHESTVARAVANKYVDCPRGLLPLRSFFTNSFVSKEGEDFSSHSVKHILESLIDEEDKRKPLSDDALSKLMKEKGISCARRTVAKYRRELNIGNTTQRRSYVD